MARETTTSDAREALLPISDRHRDAHRDDARRRRRAEAETNLVLFLGETFARASPIALGVVAAKMVEEVLDAFIDAFVSPSVALMLGSRSKALEEMAFVCGGATFRYGALLARIIDACLTLALIYATMRAVAKISIAGAPAWTPSARCGLCKSWVSADARVCPACRRAISDDDDDDDDS